MKRKRKCKTEGCNKKSEGLNGLCRICDELRIMKAKQAIEKGMKNGEAT